MATGTAIHRQSGHFGGSHAGPFVVQYGKVSP